MNADRIRSVLLVLLALATGAPAAVAPARAQGHGAPPAPDAPPPPLYPDLGTWTHPVSATGEAQAFFDQGLRLCYGFNHAEAIRAFREAARLDPNCAMAWWGVAYASGPNYNLPMDEAAATVANEAIARARALRSLVSAADREWIDALSARYSEDPGASRAGLDSAWADAMKALAKRHPRDADAGAIHAEAMMILRPWNLWTDDYRPNPGTPQIVAELERVLAMEPSHPGANHFYIHAIEASDKPEKAVAAAERMGGLVPGAGHLVHMPAHIYARIGRYDDAVKVNRKAVAVDEKYIEEQKPDGVYPLMYAPHNVHFIWFAAAMEGRSAEALEAGRKVAGAIPAEVVTQFPMVEFVPTVPVLTLVRFGRWDEALAEPPPPGDWKYATGAFHYARGVALAGKGDLDAARGELRQMREVTVSVPADQMISINYARPLLRIGLAQLEGEIAARARQWDSAIASLAQAVAAEDSLAYDEPPTWYMPVRQRLGAVMLEAGRPKDAERVFRDDLARHPENGWSLFGLAQALRAQKKEKEARAVDERFARAWQRADVRLSAAAF